MSTHEVLSYIQEFRSIIWFLVFLVAFVVVTLSVWAFWDHVEKKEGNGLLAHNNHLNDYWD